MTMSLTDYRAFGRSGLIVSPFALGTMTFGTARWGSAEDGSRVQFNAYLDAGGHFIDTADVNSSGRSEEMLGRFIAERGLRDQIVLPPKPASRRAREFMPAAAEPSTYMRRSRARSSGYELTTSICSGCPYGTRWRRPRSCSKPWWRCCAPARLGIGACQTPRPGTLQSSRRWRPPVDYPVRSDFNISTHWIHAIITDCSRPTTGARCNGSELSHSPSIGGPLKPCIARKLCRFMEGV